MKNFIISHKKGLLRTFVAVVAIALIIAIFVGSAMLYLHIAKPKLSALPGPILGMYLWLNGFSLPLKVLQGDLNEIVARVETDEFRFISYWPEELCALYKIVYGYYGQEYLCVCGGHRTE